MELDLEARLMGKTLMLNRSLDHFFEDYIKLNNLNVPLQIRRDQVDDLIPTIKEGGVVEEFRSRNDARMISKFFGYPSDCDHDKKICIDCAHNLKFCCMIGFPALSVGSSNTDVLDSPCLLVLITRTSQSSQHEKKGSYGPKFSEAYSEASQSIPQKEKDPRSFTLPCFINNVSFNNALVDLGASVRVMPLLTYLNLGLGELAHTKLTIELADRTVKYPKGIAENVLVRIEDMMLYKGNNVVGALMNVPIFVRTFSVVTDFAVLENMDDYRDEGMGDVIFGKPFLNDVGIKTRRFEGMITIHKGNDDVTYQMVRSHPRFKFHTNEQCNKIPPLLKDVKAVASRSINLVSGCEQCKGPYYTKDCPLKKEGKTLEEAYYTQDSTKGTMQTLHAKNEEKDPGSFTLPYYINNVCFNNAFADLGASDIKVPLILGRPFLSTSHAKIDVFKTKITLRVGKEKIIFKSIKPTSSLINMVYMLSLKEIMELDLEARLMGKTLMLNRSLDPFFEDYIKLNNLNVPLQIRRDQVDDLIPTIEEGRVVEEFRSRNDARMISKIFGYPSDCDHDKKIRIDCAHNLKFCCMIGIITIYNGNEELTYQMVQSHLRFKHHTNEQCNKIPPLLKVSEKDKMNEISHSYQNLKGFYKGDMNLEPEYVRDTKIEEWLICGLISVYEME
nr:hypothetical protein [Tanacetum cinerariifolium]